MGKVQPAYPRGLDFEQVWAALMENREQIKETDRQMKETDRLMKESARRQEETIRQMKEETDRRIQESARRQEETDRRMKETAEQMKETDRQIKEYNRRFGDFTNRFGEIVEYMVAPNLREKFRELRLNFPRVNSGLEVSDFENDIFFEVDVVLENGDKAMLVETKTKPSTKDVKDHVKRLEKMRRYADLRGDKRKFLGAIAGVVMTANVKQHILEQGFFAVEPSGETFNIFPPQGQPREW
jgi:alpha-galactosidase/6-phospho-beta-glucosidase family protein